MNTTKSLRVAGLRSTVAAVSFAQAPAAPANAKAPATAATAAAAAAPVDATVKPAHKKQPRHHVRKAGTTTTTASPAALTGAPPVIK